MARIAGITIEKDIHGNARYARIDLKKYGNLLNPFFKDLGIETETSHYDKKFVEKIKKSEQQMKDGKVTRLDLNDIRK
jgi:glycogen debranching enzyme